MANALTRSLSWLSCAGSRSAAIVTAFAVVLLPLALLRDELKQYTCDAFCALLVLAVGAQTDLETQRALLRWPSRPPYRVAVQLDLDRPPM